MTKKDKKTKHPATFPASILEIIDFLLHIHWISPLVPMRLLDPFVGIGGIADLEWSGGLYGVEIETEWAIQAEERGITTHTGDSRKMPWPDEHFGGICTSPAYGNRLADGYAPDMSDPKHKSRRSYRIDLGRELSAGNGGSLPWGHDYRALHRAVWDECWRVLAPGGLLLLNIKNHVRNGELQEVAKWHLEVLRGLGFVVLEMHALELRGDQNTASMRKRGLKVVDHEFVYVLRKPFPAKT